MLHNLVTRMVRAATNDPRMLSSLIVLYGNGVLADVFEPNELKSAMSVAVDTFRLVLADDDVAECGTGAKQEDSISVT